jgi:hypothetical protein
MSERLKQIKETIGYYVKQTKRLVADDRLRKVAGEKEKHRQHIVRNEKLIEKLRLHYAEAASRIRQQGSSRNGGDRPEGK